MKNSKSCSLQKNYSYTAIPCRPTSLQIISSASCYQDKRQDQKIANLNLGPVKNNKKDNHNSPSTDSDLTSAGSTFQPSKHIRQKNLLQSPNQHQTFQFTESSESEKTNKTKEVHFQSVKVQSRTSIKTAQKNFTHRLRSSFSVVGFPSVKTRFSIMADNNSGSSSSQKDAPNNNTISNRKTKSRHSFVPSNNKPFLKTLVASFHIDAPDADPNRRNFTSHQLVYTKRRAFNLKNFNEEIYAKKDIEKFMEHSVIKFHDVPANQQEQKVSIAKVVEELLKEMLEEDLETCTDADQDKIIQGIKNDMFSKIEVEDHEHHDQLIENKIKFFRKQDISLIADTLQGYEATEQSATYQNNWLAIMSNTSYISSQRVGVTKLSHGVNFGESCNNCRLLFIILTPERHSALHSPLEIARTFGTLLKTENFLQTLLSKNCSNSDEFKNLLNIEVFKRERFDRKQFAGHDDHHESKLLSYTDIITRNFNLMPHEKGIVSKTDKEVAANADQEKGEVFDSTSVETDSTNNNNKDDPKRDHSVDHGSNQNDQVVISYHCTHPADNFIFWHPFKGVLHDFFDRLPFYFSDWYDAFFYRNPKDGKFNRRQWSEIARLLKTILWIVISVLLPTLAFGNANGFNTSSKINVERTIFGQFLAGCFFSIFSSQPLGLVMTTPPITLLIKFVYKLTKILSTEDNPVDFFELYAMTGIFIGCNLILYSIFNASRFLKKITPSIEEMFAIFTSYAFLNEVIVRLSKISDDWYVNPNINSDFQTSALDDWQTSRADYNFSAYVNSADLTANINCYREKVFLWFILFAGTFSIAIIAYDTFRRTPYLNREVRNFLADYSLLISVIIWSLIYNFGTNEIKFDKYVLKHTDIFSMDQDSEASGSDSKGTYSHNYLQFELINKLTSSQKFIAWAISIPLSVLFYLDQGFCSIVVNGGKNKLQKPGGYHFDLFLVGLRVFFFGKNRNFE